MFRLCVLWMILSILTVIVVDSSRFDLFIYRVRWVSRDPCGRQPVERHAHRRFAAQPHEHASRPLAPTSLAWSCPIERCYCSSSSMWPREGRRLCLLWSPRSRSHGPIVDFAGGISHACPRNYIFKKQKQKIFNHKLIHFLLGLLKLAFRKFQRI